MTMEFEKQSSKFIKPLIPTPPTLRHYKMGSIDELAPFMNVSVVLFFSGNRNRNPLFLVHLEKSLEKTLTRLYPLAGRYVQESRIIDCNDAGVEFIHAKSNIKLQDLIGSEMNARLADEFVSFTTRAIYVQVTDPLLAVQVTSFECGGVAIGVSGTHKLVDASTLCTFLNEWGAMNREENETEFTGPGFNSSSLFPARHVAVPVPLPPLRDDDMVNKYTRKKVWFSGSQISKMKAMAVASGKSTCRLSKVQLVQEIIWKALIGVDRVTHGYRRESLLYQPVNLRDKMASSILKDSCGNLWGVCATEPTMLETTEELANLLNDSIKKTVNTFSKAYHDSEQGRAVVLDSLLKTSNIPESTNINMIPVTSWCKIPFYEVDFGFGKPVWATPGAVPKKNTASFMDDAEGNGVEAYIVLEAKDVPYFEEALDANVLGA
ncbi:hypothetical protein SSX86_007897 [Deinandra increscens subsp. villosa]|uniref:Transferase, Chloramphenicol acetyltransferase-like domain protein n=1 Tax=Deinandra increscens subsp. villosa TaxID=3103831 RepID=A0AAP0H3I1_9ASTR